jgi:hypothetical protein
MRRLILIAVALAAAAPATASAAEVELMVVGKERVLRQPADVRLKERTVKVGRKRCRVGARTPLSVLAATSLRLGIRDYGSCGKRPRDAAGRDVAKVGRERERGRGGWVYKVGRRVDSAGAGDLAGRRLRGGQRVLWFWCEQTSSGGCQRTLEATPDRTTAAPGETLSVTVRGYDDNGRGVLVEGATVRLGSATAVTGADGVAVLTVAGGGELRAEKDGMVRAFPREVTVR